MIIQPLALGDCCQHGCQWDDRSPVENGWIAGKGVIIYKRKYRHSRWRKNNLLQANNWTLLLQAPLRWPRAPSLQPRQQVVVLLWFIVPVLAPDVGGKESPDCLLKVHCRRSRRVGGGRAMGFELWSLFTATYYHTITEAYNGPTLALGPTLLLRFTSCEMPGVPSVGYWTFQLKNNSSAQSVDHL